MKSELKAVIVIFKTDTVQCIHFESLQLPKW
jgi:hypothetical protein